MHSHAETVTSTIVDVPLDDLVLVGTPRLSGEDMDHVRTLAESGAILPPILVHRPTMRVIDGMHRTRAARLRGAATIRARLVDGSEADVFVLGVKANIAHGLPLSLADRKAAAARIIELHPEWSDRRVAVDTGLSDKTVGAIRRRSPDQTGPAQRIGRDGRARALPDASARRERPRSTAATGAETPVRKPSAAAAAGTRPAPDALRIADVPTAVRRLRLDPSLRLSEAGRAVLRRLDGHLAGGWDDLAALVPEHCLGLIEGLARSCAQDWQRFAAQLHERANTHNE